MVVPMSDLALEYRSLQTEIDGAVARVLASGNYVMGAELEAFEEAFADYVGARYAMGVGVRHRGTTSGSDRAEPGAGGRGDHRPQHR